MVAGATTFPPAGDFILRYALALFCPRLRGKSGAAGKGEASAASQSAECFSCSMIQKSKSRNADFILIAQRAIPQPSAPQALSPPERSEHNPSTQPAASAAPPFLILRRSRHHNPRPERPSNLRTFRPSGRSILRTFPSEPFEPFEPGRRRRLNPHAAGVSTSTSKNTTFLP